MRGQDLDTVKSAFRRLGVTTLLAKRLAENDNSKNQIYLGGSFGVLNSSRSETHALCGVRRVEPHPRHRVAVVVS